MGFLTVAWLPALPGLGEYPVHFRLHGLQAPLCGLKIARAERLLHFALLDARAETGRDFPAVLPHTTAPHETIHPHEHRVCTVLCTSWSGTKDGHAWTSRD